MYAKKSLGQHFLKSERALNTIVDAGEISHGDTILEIGPGKGALTQKLLAVGARVTAVEKDNNLYEYLCGLFSIPIANQKLELIHGDILDFEIGNWKLKIGNYKVIANIPYNITGAILEKFLSGKSQPERMVLLVQKEVAERVAARNGKESILSISVKAYGNPRYVETVKAGSFAPAPRVDSAIISIENISKEFFKDILEAEFFRILKAGFHSKRKKLSSNLSNVVSKEKVVEAFQKLKLDPNIRAEDLTITDWRKLVSIILR